MILPDAGHERRRPANPFSPLIKSVRSRGLNFWSRSTRSNRFSAVILALMHCEHSKWRITGIEYVHCEVESGASWSLFLLLLCIPISRVIAVGYVSSHHFLLSSHGGFGVDLGAIWSSNPYIYYIPVFPWLTRLHYYLFAWSYYQHPWLKYALRCKDG